VRILFLYKRRLFFSLCAALNLKEIPYDIKPVSLIKAGGEQHCNEYREINPMEQVPALHIDGHTLVESVSNGQMLNLQLVQRVSNKCASF
jgi:glutathione S-transferase